MTNVTGLAQVRVSISVPVPVAPTTISTATISTAAPMSRTTAWRHRKKAAALAAALVAASPAVTTITTMANVATTTATSSTVTLAPPAKKPRKEYSCRVCGDKLNNSECATCSLVHSILTKLYSATGHIQYRGKKYCPKAPGQVPREEWLQQQKAEFAAAKSRAQAASQSQPQTQPR